MANDCSRSPLTALAALALAVWAFASAGAAAAPYAAMVMDAKTGEVLHARSADRKLHPASLTKMLTLYVAFEAIENGEIGPRDRVTISRHAASEPPSRLGLRAGQKIELRHLIRAAAVRSANDAATAIAEAVEGSERRFAQRMNRTARALGMKSTNFRNAHGLTQSGHVSTARDMTILGRHLIYDYPDYYHLFSALTADAGVRTVRHTNRRLLKGYGGADGIKTGYTRAAGFNLTASAERGGKRVIVTVFGGKSTSSRNAQVMKLLDLGFRRATAARAVTGHVRPQYAGSVRDDGRFSKRVRTVAQAAVAKSPRPVARPEGAPQAPAAVAGIRGDVDGALAGLAAAAAAAPQPEAPSGREQRVVERISTSGGRHWGVSVGRYPTHHEARKALLRIALGETATLGDSVRKVGRGAAGFEANFTGLTRETADRACSRLQARRLSCFVIEPGSGT